MGFNRWSHYYCNLAKMFSILIYLLFISFSLVYFVVLCLVFVVTIPFDSRRCAVHWMTWLWTKIYFGMIPGWSVETEGLENVDPKQTYVVVVNHRSMLDTLLLYVVPLNFRWVSKKEIYKMPIFGWVLWMHGDIAIERGSSSAIRKMMSEGRGWIEKGVSITVFPEGTRGKGDTVGGFKEGAFVLAKRAGVSILPVVTDGTDTALKGWRFNFRNRFRVSILEPISAQEVAQSGIKDMTSKVQQLISTEYSRIRVENIKKEE